MKPTVTDLRERAEKAIESGDAIARDVAARHGQIFDNVKYTRWFRDVVMQELIDTRKKYQHLEEVI